jgi:hypothetical protein
MEPYYKGIILLRLYSLCKRLTPFSSKVLFLFEPFIPFFVLLLLRRTLRNLKSKGTINAYFINIVRISKLHYKAEVRLILTMTQIDTMAFDLVNKLFRSLNK